MTQPSDTLFVGSSELARLMRATEWGRTPVGEPAQWPQSVQAIVRLMLTSRYAMWMGWGPELTFFYNDAYAEMSLGKKHPWAANGSAALVAVFAQAPVPIAILRGAEYVFEMANDAYVALAGRRVLGRRVADAFPEIVSQGIVELLQNVRATRQPFVGRAVPVYLNRGHAGPRPRASTSTSSNRSTSIGSRQ